MSISVGINQSLAALVLSASTYISVCIKGTISESSDKSVVSKSKFVFVSHLAH